jgi:hypothetical protein
MRNGGRGEVGGVGGGGGDEEDRKEKAEARLLLVQMINEAVKTHTHTQNAKSGMMHPRCRKKKKKSIAREMKVV